MPFLYCDLETFNERSLKTVGTYAYAETAEIMLFGYALDDAPVKVWDLTATKEMPDDLRNALYDKGVMTVWHNSMFDRNVLKHNGIELPVERVHDTMVQALQHSLPGGLDTLCEIFKVPQDKAKDKEGKRLIQFFCCPRPAKQKLRRATKETHPEEWARFVSYAVSDIEAMRYLHRIMPKFNTRRDIWELDQKINDRGFLIDIPMVDGFLNAISTEQAKLKKRAKDITNGEVESTAQRDALMRFVSETYGVVLKDLRASTVENLLEDLHLPPEAKELLMNRLEMTTTSTAKYKTLKRAVSADNRMRGTLQFCGASRTGRWCLAEGSQILVQTRNGTVTEKAIEKVLNSDLVWDGAEWVRHDGVVFSGDKEVIEHDGVIATPEHIVYVSDTESLSLGEAKALNIPLWKGFEDRMPIILYRITSPSGRAYVGITSQKLGARWRQHVQRAVKKVNHPFYCSIRKYGKDAFSVEKVAAFSSWGEACEAEIEAIANNIGGYNVSPGGFFDGSAGAKALKELLKDSAFREEYIKRLREGIAASATHNSPENLAIKTATLLLWRKTHPREAYKIAHRGSRCALRKRGLVKKPKQETNRVIRRKNHQKATRAVWASRSSAEVEAISAKISESVAKVHADKTVSEREQHQKQLSEARKNIDHDKRKRNQKAALVAYWTPERRREFGDRVKARNAEKKKGTTP